MMRITSHEGNRQSLDGGAMFGNVPRALWQRWCEPDEQGRIALSCRCFLVEVDGKKVLLETGVGCFFEPRLRERYGVIESEHVLLDSLAAAGVEPEDIDVVLLSHLHFDHAGGLLTPYSAQESSALAFSRAQFIVGETAWQRACQPHPRDRASFIPELLELLRGSGRLQVVAQGAETHPELGDSFRLRTSSGHTPGMLIPTILGRERSATFCADLVPGVPWVHLPVTMGYDRFPELLIDEKRELYEALGENSWLLLTHDPKTAAGRLARDEKGKYQLVEATSCLDAWEL